MLLGCLAGPPPEAALAWRVELPAPARSSLQDYGSACGSKTPSVRSRRIRRSADARQPARRRRRSGSNPRTPPGRLHRADPHLLTTVARRLAEQNRVPSGPGPPATTGLGSRPGAAGPPTGGVGQCSSTRALLCPVAIAARRHDHEARVAREIDVDGVMYRPRRDGAV